MYCPYQCSTYSGVWVPVLYGHFVLLYTSKMHCSLLLADCDILLRLCIVYCAFSTNCTNQL